jgi:hypothetical protein
VVVVWCAAAVAPLAWQCGRGGGGGGGGVGGARTGVQ